MVPSMYYHSDEHHVEASGIMNAPDRPHQSSLATDQLLLTDHGNCPQSSQLCPGNEGPACKPATIYVDILILERERRERSTAMITVGSRYPGGWII